MSFKDFYIPVNLPWQETTGMLAQSGLHPTKLTAYVEYLERKYGTIKKVPYKSDDYVKLAKLADECSRGKQL